jgi:hypothetical protein
MFISPRYHLTTAQRSPKDRTTVNLISLGRQQCGSHGQGAKASSEVFIPNATRAMELAAEIHHALRRRRPSSNTQVWLV